MQKTERYDIIVVGGNDAGLAAAGRAKRLKPDLNILVLEKTPHVGYASCALPNMIAGTVDPAPLAGDGAQAIAAKRGFHVLTQTHVTAIRTMQRTISVQTQNNEHQELAYRKLLLTVGAEPNIPEPLTGLANNRFTLRNYYDAQQMLGYITDRHPGSALIVGGGYIGIEVAEALYHRGISVTIVDVADRLFPAMTSTISEALQENLQQKGIQLILGAEIKQCIYAHNEINRVLLNNGNAITADMVVVAAGVHPASKLAFDAGIPLAKSGAIIVNDYLQTRRMDIYAAGDCIETRNLVTGKPAWLPLAGIASKQGRIAGSNLAGNRETFPGALGTFMVRAFGLEFGMTGLSLQYAQNAGFDAAESIITQRNKPGYMSGATPISTSLIIDKKTQRILGGQMIGAADVGLRLNILAAAITGKMTARDLEFMDLGYTPLINNMWDPLSIAGNAAQKL